MTSIVLSVHEPSADASTADLVRALRRMHPDAAFAGLGGPAMAQAGVELWKNTVEASLMGLVEVVGEIRNVLRLIDVTARRIAALRPDVVIIADAPDFNIRLAKAIKRRAPHIPIVYFLCPQVWGWRIGRIAQLRRYCDDRLCLFRFEPRWYVAHYTQGEFIGHPLVDRAHAFAAEFDGAEWGEALRERVRTHLSLDPQARILGLIPGSRRKEIKAMLPRFLQAAHRVKAMPEASADNRPWHVLIAGTPGRPLDLYLSFIHEIGLPGPTTLVSPDVDSPRTEGNVQLLPGRMYHVAAAADACLSASGTATTETAYLDAPQVIGYRINPLSALAGHFLVSNEVRHVSMVNILSRKEVVPELLQTRCTPANLARTVTPMLFDPAVAARIRQDYRRFRAIMGPAGAVDRAAERINKLFL